MAGFLKAKLAVSAISIAIIILVALLDSNFNAKVTIKRWGKLTWDDFQGFPQPLSGYGAVIGSQLYLEFDSASSRYIAFAGQHNIVSWTKESTKDSDYALNHEQYHFNITELHARLLNEYINDNPNESELTYSLRLNSLWLDLSSMQEQYDDETDHSLIVHKQRLWEFKIDSMLSRHSADSGSVTDYYSGARAYFPDTPEFRSELTENPAAIRQFILTRYDMTLSLTSYQYPYIDEEALETNIRQYYSEHAREVETFVTDTSVYKFKGVVVTKDSMNITLHNLWVFNGSYLYRLSASYSADTTEMLGYQQIANSFISSFSLQNTDDYWMIKFNGSKSRGSHSTLTAITPALAKSVSKSCLKRGQASQYGFYRGPMFRKDGGLLIAYDIMKHADTLVRNTSLIINDEIYDYEPDSTDRLFFVPGDDLPKKHYEIHFGYQLSQDSTRDCYILYHQALAIDPNEIGYLAATNLNGK